MPLDSSARPGMPSRSFTYIAEATLGSGAIDVDTSLVTDTNKVTPLVSFAYAGPDGDIAFYKGFPRVVTPGIKAELIAAGLVV